MPPASRLRGRMAQLHLSGRDGRNTGRQPDCDDHLYRHRDRRRRECNRNRDRDRDGAATAAASSHCHPDRRPHTITAGDTSTLTVAAANATSLTIAGTDGTAFTQPALLVGGGTEP